MSQLETLNSDLLDERFIKILKPLIIMQAISGSARVNVRHKFVTSPTRYQKMIGSVYMIYCVIIHVTLTEWWVKNGGLLEYNFSLLQVLLFASQIFGGLALNTCVGVLNNFFYNKENPELILALQRIDQLLENVTDKNYGKWIRRFVITGICLVLMESLALVIPAFFSPGPRQHILYILPTLIFFLSEKLEVLFLCTILLFACARTRQINEILEKGLNDKVGRKIQMVFRNMLLIQNIVEKTFSPLILLIVMSTFFSSLIIFQKGIEVARSKEGSLLIFRNDCIVLRHQVTVVTFSSANIYLESLLERLMRNCIQATTKYREVSISRAMKNMRREASLQEPASVYHMFLVRSLPLNLALVVTDYAIVLLQFALTDIKRYINADRQTMRRSAGLQEPASVYRMFLALVVDYAIVLLQLALTDIKRYINADKQGASTVTPGY